MSLVDLNTIIITQLGTMTALEAINMLEYTHSDFIGFDLSMLVSYIDSLIITSERVSHV